MNEKNFQKLLHDAEEYEDVLDLLHPEDKVDPDLTKLETLSFTPSSKLAIVVGHTKRSPGAKGVAPISMHEYFWNNKLASNIKSISSQNDIECAIFFRDGIGISGAYKEVSDWSPNSCIELHFNAYNGQVKGTETLYGEHDQSKIWADTLQNAMVVLYTRTTVHDRGIKLRKISERGGKNVNQLDNIPSCLIEPYFGDELSEAVLAKDHLVELAQAIVTAHKNIFN